MKFAPNSLVYLSGKELFIRFTASAFCKLLSIYVFSCFPFGFEGRMWDLIVSVPDHCLSFYLRNFGNGFTVSDPFPFINTCKGEEIQSDIH